MNEQARPMSQHRNGGGEKRPVLEGPCKAVVISKPKAFDKRMWFAYADASQKLGCKKFCCVSVCVQFGPKQNIIQKRCCHTVQLLLMFRVVFCT